MADTALALHILLPGAQYEGNPGKTKADFDSLRWLDQRTKPTWAAVQAVDLSAYLEKSQALDSIQSLGIVSLLKLLDEVVKIQIEQTAAIRAAGGTISNYQPEIVELWTEFHNRLNELQ